MALDPSKIAPRPDSVYTAGQINFKIASFRDISVGISEKSSAIAINETYSRTSLVRHSAELMRCALGYTGGLTIDVGSQTELRHCGFGSSSNIIASTGFAINELFGNPLDQHTLAGYFARNHGEEIDGIPDLLSPVQCIGGSAMAGITDGGIFIMAGEQAVIATTHVPNAYHFVVGVPKNYNHPDAEYLFAKELEAMPKFIKTGQLYGPTVAYRLVHEVLPDLTRGNFKELGRLVFDYRFDMGSIENCSFVYPPMIEIARKIRSLMENGIAEVLALSSVGPGFFALTENPDECVKVFQEADMKTSVFEPYNEKYKVVYE